MAMGVLLCMCESVQYTLQLILSLHKADSPYNRRTETTILVAIYFMLNIFQETDLVIDLL